MLSCNINQRREERRFIHSEHMHNRKQMSSENPVHCLFLRGMSRKEDRIHFTLSVHKSEGLTLLSQVCAWSDACILEYVCARMCLCACVFLCACACVFDGASYARDAE